MRKSSRGYSSGDRADHIPTRAAELMSFEPSAAQTRVKAALWARLRDDPSQDAHNLTLAAAEQLTDSPSLKSWWSDPGFRSWFLNQDEWREQVETAFDLWITGTVQRLKNPGAMSDKDHIALGKVLGEMADKMPRASKDQPRDALAGLTPAQQLEKFRQVALSLGYTPPAALPAAGDDPEESK